jgi:hypothetical protein
MGEEDRRRTRRLDASRLTEEALALLDVPSPPRWFVRMAYAIDDIDFTGGNTLVELANELSERNIVFAPVTVTRAGRPELDRFGVTAAIGPGRISAT